MYYFIYDSNWTTVGLLNVHTVYMLFSKLYECLYFSTLHSFLFFTTCFSFSYWFMFFLMHYWRGCKAKYIWCLHLYLSLIFNCYPLPFREFLFFVKVLNIIIVGTGLSKKDNNSKDALKRIRGAEGKMGPRERWAPLDIFLMIRF